MLLRQRMSAGCQQMLRSAGCLTSRCEADPGRCEPLRALAVHKLLETSKLPYPCLDRARVIVH